MFHPQKIAAKIQAIEQAKGIRLRENSVADCIRLYEHFKSMEVMAGKKVVYARHGESPASFQLTSQEKQWIENEMYMCACSFPYWFFRYFFIKTKEGDITRPDVLVAQEVFLKVISELDVKNLPMLLLILKARQLGQCLHPSTRVLMEDLTWRAIEYVKVGEKVVSIDEFPKEGRGQGRKMRSAVVTGKRDVKEKAFKLTMDDGRVLIATGSHKFLSKKYIDSSETTWRRVDQMNIRDAIRFITEPWEGQSYEDGWMAGFIDGEGSFSKKSRTGCSLNVSQVMNGALKRASNYLNKERYNFRVEVDKRKKGESSKFGDKHVYKLVIGRMDEAFRLLGKTRPERFISNTDWWQGKDLPGKNSGVGWCRIAEISELPEQRMIDLETSTKTYIAEGFVSHNSTIIEAVILYISIFVKGSHCVVASAEEEKSEQMSNMIWIGLEMLPLWMQPVLTREDRKLGPEFGLIHSDILLQHGSMSKGISRGDTPNAAHLSEVAYYPDPINTIESSLIRAMHENPRTFLALETTARKKDDWFHRTWLKNRKGELTGYNRFTCLFLPWYVGRDKYPTADWLRNHPIPQHWRVVSDGRNEPWRLIQGRVEIGPLKETLKQAADAKLYVATTKLLKDHMPENWEMPPEQMWYWEFNYVEAIEGDDETLKSFLAELAADERSCFQSKKLSVFTQDVLDKLEENLNHDYQCYAMAGDGIDKRFALADFHSHSKRRIDINWQTINGDFLHWKLIPLKEEPQDVTLKYYLKIWEHPKPGYDYTIGIDIASGIGQNNTVYFVLKKGIAGAPDEEVALLYSPWIPSPETPPFANMLGVYYGQHMSPIPEAMIAPEVQKAVGDFISHQLAKLGYTNFYYMERFDIRKAPGHRPNRRGWASVGWSQQMMKEAFEHGIKSGWIQINSEELLAELDSLEAEETDSGKMMYDHASDHTDDAYVAGGIAYFVTHGQETIMERMKADLKPTRKSKKEIAVQEPDKGATLLARQFQREDRAEFPGAGEEGEGDPLRRVY